MIYHGVSMERCQAKLYGMAGWVRAGVNWIVEFIWNYLLCGVLCKENVWFIPWAMVVGSSISLFDSNTALSLLLSVEELNQKFEKHITP